MHGNTRFARVHPADAIHQRLARHILEQITFRAGLNGAVDIFVAVECCEHDDARVLVAPADFLDCADAIELWHSQIKQCHVGPVLFPKIDCLTTILGFSNDSHVRFTLDQ